MTDIKRVAIVGRDADLWLSALALHAALAPAGVSVIAIELPSALNAHDALAAAPSLSGLHNLIGLDRRDVLRVCGGIAVGAQRYPNWSRNAFYLGYDAQRAAINDIDILQYWVKARSEGSSLPFHQLSIAAVASAQGRVAPDNQDPASFGTVHRAYHLDATAYSGALAGLARQRGVEVVRSSNIGVDFDGDTIRSVVTDSGAPIAADLFVDASGPAAVLLARAHRDSWQDWSEWLPAGRVVVSSAPPLNPRPAFTDIRAVADGWVSVISLLNRTAICAVFEDGRDAGDRAAIAGAIGTNSIADPVARELRPGARTPWFGNCVAIGSSATSLLPIDQMDLQLTHAGLVNLIHWFPTGADMIEARSYNQVVGNYARNVRDFQAAHFRLNERFGEPYWDRLRLDRGPHSLNQRLDLFATRALVPSFDEESFDEVAWAAMLVGHGLIPSGYDPKVDDLPLGEMAARMQQLIDVVEQRAAQMPSVSEYLGG